LLLGQAPEQLGGGLVSLESGCLSLASHLNPAAEGVIAELRGGLEQGLAAGQGGVLHLERGMEAALRGRGPQGEEVAIDLAGQVEIALGGGDGGLGGVEGAAGVVGGNPNGLVDGGASGGGGSGVRVGHRASSFVLM